MATFGPTNVAAIADDADITGSTFGSTANYGTIGDKYGTNYDLFARFTNVTIPAGSTIDSALLSLHAVISDANTTCNLNVYCVDENSPAAPTDATEFNALALTAAVAWSSVSAWTEHERYNSVVFAAAVQEVVDRAGWAS